jgi:hypothetical protein
LTLGGEEQALARIEECLHEIERASRVTAEGPG